MNFTVDLEYTSCSPQDGLPFTEETFCRRSIPFTFDVKEVGIALVDLWNFGWDDGPFDEELGDRSFERGRSHAERKRRIIETKVGPLVNTLRDMDFQIFHCNQADFLKHYPQWSQSTTDEERQSLSANPASSENLKEERNSQWPPQEWVDSWKNQHRELIWRMKDWANIQGKLYYQISIPEPVEPQDGDLLVYFGDQFHRLLVEKRIKILFYMGFETDECLMNKPHGIRNMSRLGYMPIVVTDCTTTYEAAETLDGLWKTRVTILNIEAHQGYSVTSEALLKSLKTLK